MIEWIIIGVVAILVVLAVIRLIRKRNDPCSACEHAHQIYGIPQSEMPDCCQACRKTGNPGTDGSTAE